MLRFINNFIAEAIPGKPGHSSSIYPLNDGISPASSGLLLTNDFVEHSRRLRRGGHRRYADAQQCKEGPLV
jgi:hypothetical protein